MNSSHLSPSNNSTSPILLAFYASLFAWFGSALGASLIFVLPKVTRKFLDASLGFSSGVMIAASFWSLLIPAIETSKTTTGSEFYIAFIVAFGFILGVCLVLVSEKFLPDEFENVKNSENIKSIRRIFLFIVVTIVHNIPEGLAGGVAFGSIGQTPTLTFENAVKLATAIALHNFTEGLTIAFPLVGFGWPKWKAFLFCQISGLLGWKPIASVPAAFGVMALNSILPYAYSCAAGAMIYVVIDDLIPEAQAHGNGRLVSIAAMIGFIVIMFMEIVLDD